MIVKNVELIAHAAKNVAKCNANVMKIVSVAAKGLVAIKAHVVRAVAIKVKTNLAITTHVISMWGYWPHTHPLGT